MFQKVLTSIFGSRNQRLLKQYGKAVEGINALEASLSTLSDDELRAKTVEFRQRIATETAAGKDLAQALEDLRKGGPAFDLELRITTAGRHRRCRSSPGPSSGPPANGLPRWSGTCG